MHGEGRQASERGLEMDRKTPHLNQKSVHVDVFEKRVLARVIGAAEFQAPFPVVHRYWCAGPMTHNDLPTRRSSLY